MDFFVEIMVNKYVALGLIEYEALFINFIANTTSPPNDIRGKSQTADSRKAIYCMCSQGIMVTSLLI